MDLEKKYTEHMIFEDIDIDLEKQIVIVG